MKKYFKYLGVIILTALMFSMPCRALDITKLSIKVGSLELNLKKDEFNYSIKTAFNKEEIEIKVRTDEDVQIIGDGIIKLETKVTNHDLKLMENQKEYTYHLKITKKDPPRDPNDFGVTVFLNGHNINEALASDKTTIYEKCENVGLYVRINNEDVQVTSKLGLYPLKEEETLIPLTLKTKDEEYTYNLKIIKKDMSQKEKKVDKTLIDKVIRLIYTLLIIGVMIWSYKNHALICFSICTLLLLFNLCFTIVKLDGQCMEDTLHDKEEALTINSYLAKYNRGDIVVAYIPDYQYGGKVSIIKRIVGMPNDKISIKNNILYINGQKQEEKYLKEAMDTWDLEITLKDDEYFLMGDNRNNSYDSRIYGAVKKEEITNEVIFK